MADRRRAVVRATKKTVAAGVGALALSAVFAAWGAGTANADVIDIDGKPSFEANPVPEGGVRTARPGVPNSGTAADVRRSAKGEPLAPSGGEVKDSLRAVPGITGGSSNPFRRGPHSNNPGMWEW
ncbi:hypothetical protein E4P42_20690 [Mycobacterium sp. PS03-16]|nr:hypothetical protein E4P42_20690 [Mycobacterium sp. PS03-16]